MNKYLKKKNSDDNKDNLVDNSSDSKNSEDYKKLKKYIMGIDSDESKKGNKSSEINNSVIPLKKYNKIINLCKEIEICIKNPQKKKTMQQLIDLCHKKKRIIIKNNIVDLAKYCTTQGYEQLAGTYIIESKNDKMVQQLRCVDKIIEYILQECQVDKNNNIISQLNLKQVLEKKKTSKIILEEYSDNV
jgi:hypothetical protein